MSAYLVGFVGEKNDKAYFHRKMKDGTNFPTSIITLQISIRLVEAYRPHAAQSGEHSLNLGSLKIL
jgi:hypothetical protein